MWLKNIRLFQFQSPMPYNPDKLDQCLSEGLFKPCPKSHALSYGWVAPMGDESNPLVYGQNNFMLVRLRIEEKVLPVSVVREHLQAEIKQLEQKTGRRIYKDEKERLKDDIYQTLLTRAFSKSSYINGFIDCKKNWLVVDCASHKRLSYFISMFMKCSQQTISIPKLNSIPAIITAWVKENHYPSSFALANACLLKGADENGSMIRVKNQDLLSHKIQNFLKDGSQITQLALEWQEQIRFTLKEDLSLSSVKFLEAVKDLSRDGLSESKEERLASDFTLMAETVRQLLEDFLPYFLLQNTEVLESIA